jgi:hypothetical protein
LPERVGVLQARQSLLNKALSPFRDPRQTGFQAKGNLACRQSLRREQDHASPLDFAMFTSTGSGPSGQVSLSSSLNEIFVAGWSMPHFALFR